MAQQAKRRTKRQPLASDIRRLESIVNAAKLLNSTFELDRLLHIILDLATSNLRADRGTIYLIDESKHVLWSKVLKGSGMIDLRLPLGTGIAGTVAMTGETVNLKDARKDTRFFAGVDRQSGFTTCTMLCMPMKDRDGKIVGVFQIINKKRGVFDAQDELFLEAFSEHAAIALENARLYQARLESERVNREISIAAEMQQRLLPKQIPNIEGYAVAAEAHPCYSIGGDFYDIIRMDEHRYAFVIADVSGKGIPAAMLVSTLHASLRVYLQNPTGLSERQRLAELVSKLNALVYENSPAERFITFVIVVLDVLTHRAAFVNAGHNPPYFHAAATSTISSLDATGIPLGLIESSSYEAQEVQFLEGDTLLLYTDGVTEAMSRSKAQFGEDRLKHLLAEVAPLGTDRVRSKVISSVRRFQGKEPASDDITLLVMKRLQ